MMDEEIHIRLQSLEDYPGQLRVQVQEHTRYIAQIRSELQALMEDYSKFKQAVYTIHPELLI